MEEGSAMVDGFEGGGGLVSGEEGKEHKKGAEVLDQEMGGCREVCLPSSKAVGVGDRVLEGVGEGVLEGVLDSKKVHDLRMDAEMKDKLPVLADKERVGVKDSDKPVLNWRKAVVGNVDVEKVVQDGGFSDVLKGGERIVDYMEADGEGGIQGVPLKGGVATAGRGVVSPSFDKVPGGNLRNIKHYREGVLKRSIGGRKTAVGGAGAVSNREAGIESMSKGMEGSLSSSVDNGVRKRRRGDEGGVCGGDASPLARE